MHRKMTAEKVFPKLATSFQHPHVEGGSPNKREKMPGTKVSTTMFVFSPSTGNNSSGRGNCGDHTVADLKDIFCLLFLSWDIATIAITSASVS